MYRHPRRELVEDHTVNPLSARFRRIIADQSGQATVLNAICLFTIMGLMALAVDVGYFQYRQRQLQTAADSAAIAAGLEIGNCGNTVCQNMKTAAAAALIEDGLTGSTITPSSSCTVSTTTGLGMIINNPPCVLGSILNDPNYDNTHMAEVVLTEPQPTFFGTVFGIKNVNLMARAEAGDSYINTANSGGNCIYTDSLAFNSSDGNFNLTSCGIYDNGNLQTDNGDSVTASSFLYYGTWSPNNCNNSCTWSLGSSQTQPNHTTTAESDPLASLTAPGVPTTTYTGTTSFNSGTNNLSPGYYQNGFNINGGTVNLAAGIYYMGGSINIDSGATLTGTNVTLYFNNGSLQPNSGSVVQLTAPTSNTTGCSCGNANMVVWESKSNGSGMTVDASSTSYYNGVIYLPDATLTLNSGSGTTINSGSTATALDAQSIIVDSSVTFVINGSGGYLGGGRSQTLGAFALSE
jgi:Flp pilus assembly protein TadG